MSGLKVLKIEKTVAKKLVNGTLPDIDTDFSSTGRDRVKRYMEQRFGEKQVCSVGSFTTMQIKGLLKDLGRTAGVDFQTMNLVTSIISQDEKTLPNLIEKSMYEPKLKKFLKENSDLVHLLPTLVNQARAASIHPCAVIIFPEVLETREWCPARMQNGILVSEWGGNEMDDAGFLKEDILGIKQLTKFEEILKLVEKSGKEAPDIYNLPHDKEVFRYFSNGWNGDVFQLGSEGLTDYSRQLKPQTIDDLVAAVALYRPGPMQNHYHEIYVKCKNEGREPKFLWQTESITENTFGMIIYQEQVMEVFRQIGGLSMKEADDVRRAMGKKKLEVLLPWKTRVQKGFFEKGATEQEFLEVWEAVEEFAKYGFNKSHATAYALTAYICQYLKVHFPLEYWTVSLGFASDANKLRYLSEISQTKAVELLPLDINISGIEMTSSQAEKSIFWGIGSVKGIGEETARQIVVEREKNGAYKSFTDFLLRHVFKGSKVKKQTYEALISCGAFDKLYEIEGDKTRRNFLIKRFRKVRKVKVSNLKTDLFTVGQYEKNWWWKLVQKEYTGLSAIDYKNIAQEEGFEGSFLKTREINQRQEKGLFRTFGGYVVEMKVSKSKRGSFARLTIENNYSLHKVIIWSDEYERFKDQLSGCEKSIIVFKAFLRYEAKWAKGNQFTFTEDSELKVLKTK